MSDNLKWIAKVHHNVDDILTMIKNRNNPECELPSSRWFETKEEAEYFAFNTGLKTGARYSVYHRDDNPNSVYNQVRSMLKKGLEE